MATPRLYKLLQLVIVPKIKHHLCRRRDVLEGNVQPLGRQELESKVPKPPLLDRHIIHVSKLVLTRK